MTIETTNRQASIYLFNRGAVEIFPKVEEGFANRSLETLMRIIDHLVATNSKVLAIFDPAAFNNQCHLYALKTVETIGSKDRRFLYLSFFLSYAFLQDSKLLVKVAQKALVEMQEEPPNREFELFLKDPEGQRMHASRSALNELFRQEMQSLEDGSEVALLAKEDLMHLPERGNEPLYTLPKFAGVALLIDKLSKEKIPLVFKVKVMAPEGNGTFTYSEVDLKELHPKTPVIVFEMIATGEDISFLDATALAKKCPSYSMRNVKSKDRHSDKISCRFCRPESADVSEYQKIYKDIFARSSEMLLSLGADFIQKKQGAFLPLFQKEGSDLTRLFNESIPRIEEFHLKMDEPSNISVAHVYADRARYALSDEMILGSSYETHLKRRELI